MQKLEVFGAQKLRGQVKISGSKNASLPILAASLLSNKQIILKNLLLALVLKVAKTEGETTAIKKIIDPIRVVSKKLRV